MVYIAVDNAKGVTQYGGTVAAPIAKNIMTSIIDILDIEKRSGSIEKEYTYLDKKYISVPNVVGMSESDARKALKGFNIKVEGSGKVLYQSPEAGTKILEGETVRIYMQ